VFIRVHLWLILFVFRATSNEGPRMSRIRADKKFGRSRFEGNHPQISQICTDFSRAEAADRICG